MKILRRIPAPYLLLIPWFIGISVFRLFAMGLQFYYSFTEFHPMGAPIFIGLQNYIFMFTQDPVFWPSVRATLQYVLVGTPLVLIMALFIASILNFKLRGVNFFRTAYYIPSILGGNVAVSILWRSMFDPQGPVNSVIVAFGGSPINWIMNPTFAPFTIILLSAWQFGSVMLIFLAALQNVSPSLYEAASIDGASKTRQLFTITLPIITPVILFNTMNVLLRHFQEFNAPFLITNQGGPLNATMFLNLRIYLHAFPMVSLGYAAALTMVLLLGIGSISAIIFATQKSWVHYND
ncbi:MAG: sugar ABC transporter permease [Defluviitaleaceae bacterium]|nr:sugar ABC transporter permease [Defluviitaleaceae bacterium]